MVPTPIPGAAYGDGWPGGPRVTSVSLPPGGPFDALLFIRVSQDGRIVGKAHNSFDIPYWTGTQWIVLYTGTTPNAPAAFHPTSGEIYVSIGDTAVYSRAGVRVRTLPGYVGAQGIRQVNPDGTIVTAKDTYGIVEAGVALLGQYTPVGDLAIGQGVTGGVEVVFDHQRHRVCDGDPEWLTVEAVGDQLAIYFTDYHTGSWLETTGTALRALPPIVDSVIGPTTPPRTPSAQRYDLGTFLLSDAALQPRSGPTHPQHQLDLATGVVQFVKFGNPQAYEMWGLDADWLYHLEDASAGSTYSLSDPRWILRQMPIGYAAAFVTGPHAVIHRARGTCAETGRDPIDRRMWLEAVYDGWQWGPDLGIRPTVVVVYDNTAGIHSAGRLVEVYYLADGAGWCRWEAHRSDLVYADPAHPVFTDATRVARSDFYQVGPPDTPIDLTGCVPATLPPPSPPHGQGDLMQLFASVDPSKVVVAHATIPSKAFPGCVNVILQDGSVFSAQGDTRPAGTDGPWEAGQLQGSLIAYHDNTAVHVYGIVLTDKLP